MGTLGRLGEEKMTSHFARRSYEINGSQGIPMVAVNLAPAMGVARVRLFATHSHNPLFVYKAFQFATSLLKFSSYSCLLRSLSNDFELLFLYTLFSSHIVHEHALLHTWTCTSS